MFYNKTGYSFWFSFLALSIDHEVSKFYENDEKFQKFKEECSKTGTTEEAIAVGEKLVLNKSLCKKPFKTKRNGSSLFC